jgi:hypothetical protein
MIFFVQYKKPAFFEAGSVGFKNFAHWGLREPIPIAFFNAAHGSEQMVIRACPELLRLAVQHLHHQRVENADLLQCCHIAMDASERCVETVKKIVDEGFVYATRIGCAAKIGVSHRSPF